MVKIRTNMTEIIWCGCTRDWRSHHSCGAIAKATATTISRLQLQMPTIIWNHYIFRLNSFTITHMTSSYSSITCNKKSKTTKLLKEKGSLSLPTVYFPLLELNIASSTMTLWADFLYHWLLLLSVKFCHY